VLLLLLLLLAGGSGGGATAGGAVVPLPPMRLRREGLRHAFRRLFRQ
jgi:hypothetical protein